MIVAPPAAPGPVGLYIHFPFCAIRCSYCDFATVAGRDERIGAYVDGLCRELTTGQQELGTDVDTVFFGGGTPSRMTPDQVNRILAAVHARFRLARDTEVTLECNPESLSTESLAGYADAGITRVSIGVQSLDDAVLRRVGRAHDAHRARMATQLALAAGRVEVSVDLIAGLPGEEEGNWASTLRSVADWGIDHVSVYLLETDKETPLARSVRAGRTRVMGEDDQARLYETTVTTLRRCGFEGYEISNFARRGRRSRHNLKYWTDAWYGGFGVGAHGYFAGARRANPRDLETYLARVGAGEDPGEIIDPWDPVRRIEEALILGLRRTEGPDLDRLSDRYHIDLASAYAEVWEAAERQGLLSRKTDESPRLTDRGRLLSNRVFVELLDRLSPPDMS